MTTMKPTLSWDLPVPEEISSHLNNYYTAFQKKIKIADGEEAYVKFKHLWSKGITSVCYNAWESGETKVDKFVYRHGEEQYDGERFVERSAESIRKDPDFHNVVFVRIGEMKRQIYIDVVDNIVVIRYFSFIGHIPEANEIGEFKEFKRIFIKDGVVWTEIREKPNEKFVWEKKHIKPGLRSIVNNYKSRPRIVINDMTLTQGLMENFKGAYFNGNLLYNINIMFDYLPTLPKNDKFQRKIDELTKKHAKIKVKINESNLFHMYLGKISNSSHKLGYYQRIDENSAVIRLYYEYHNKIVEYARIYADKDNIYPCYYANGVVSRCDKEDEKFWQLSIPMKRVDINGTAFEKYYPEMKKREFDAFEVFMTSKYCCLEQLSKIGLDEFCRSIIRNNQVKELIKQAGLLTEKPKTKRTLKDLFNKIQMKYILIFNNRIKNKNDLDHLLNFIEISGVENKDLISYICETTKNRSVSDYTFYHLGRTLNTLRNCLNTDKEKTAIMKSVIRQYGELMNTQDYFPFSTLQDTYEMYFKVYEDKVVLKRELKKLSNMRNRDTIKETHDIIMPLVKNKGYNEERFKKIVEEKKKYEFENEDFSIMLPKETKDVITEGKRMHHCVGSYIDSIISGFSTILFLRKKENITHEYVTIEVNNSGELLQAKCKNNKLLQSEKTLNFLTEWVKNKKIKVNTHDVSMKKGILCPANKAYCGFFEE